jgi:hypothetical protein
MDERAAHVVDFVVTPRTGAQVLRVLGESLAARKAISQFGRHLLRLGVLEESPEEDQPGDLLAGAKTVEWGSETESPAFV